MRYKVPLTTAITRLIVAVAMIVGISDSSRRLTSEVTVSTARLNVCPQENWTEGYTLRAWLPPETLLQSLKINESMHSSVVVVGEEIGGLFEFNLEDTGGLACENKSSVDIVTGINGSKSSYFTTDGYFYHGSKYFPPSSYCISSISDTALILELCSPNCDEDVCIHKCCPLGWVVSRNLKNSIFAEPTCVQVEQGTGWRPVLGAYNYTNDEVENEDEPLELFYFEGFPKCWYRILAYSPHPAMSSFFHYDLLISENGSIYSRTFGKADDWGVPKAHDICVDGLLDTSGTQTYTRNYNNQIYFQCYEPRNIFERYRDVIYTIVFYSRVISGILLFSTAIIYVLLWDKMSIHGWTIAAFCFCSSIDYVTLGGALGIILYNDAFIGTTRCYAFGILHHYAAMTSCVWMTTLSYDLCRTISLMTTPTQRSRGRRKFAAYCLISFGLPAIFISASVTLDYYDLGDGFPKFVKPEYGRHACSLSHNAVFYYVVIPEAINFAVNLVFGVLCIRSLYRISSGVKGKECFSTKKHKRQVLLLGKLFVITGLTLSLEVATNLIPGEISKYIGVVALFVELARGFVLSWVFTCTRKNKALLLEKYGRLRAATDFLERSVTYARTIVMSRRSS